MYDTLVLSGGGVNGILELGSLQYCNDKGLLTSIKTYVGTSVGAIICYLLIIGYTPIEIIVYLCTNSKMFDKLKVVDINAGCRGDGATSFLHILECLEHMTTEKIGKLLTMKDIPLIFNKKFICTTFNVTKNITEYLSDETFPDLPCLSALRMTANIPFIFENYKYGSSFYVDGGICDNFPLEVAESYGNCILGIAIMLPIEQNSDFYPQKNLLSYSLRLLSVSLEETTKLRIRHKKESTKVVILSANNQYDSIKFSINSKSKLEMFSQGYNQTSAIFDSTQSTPKQITEQHT
jgi:predicted acylesterase/phospholipase RssA